MSNESPRAKPGVRKTLTHSEEVFLDAVCRTGGGGAVLDTTPRGRKAMRLWYRGLVVNKPGATDRRVIHSAKGLAYWRALQAEGIL